jgi:hypothetical protein
MAAGFVMLANIGRLWQAGDLLDAAMTPSPVDIDSEQCYIT